MATRLPALFVAFVACGGTPAPSPVVQPAPPITRPPAPVDARAAVMNDCAGHEKLVVEPDALPPDLAVKPRLLVVYDEDTEPLRDADRAKLIAAVSKRLRTLVKLPQLTRKELSTAEALVAQRRLTANGLVCGQAPRLTQVLGAAHRHIVIATIATYCLDLEGKDCSLRVSFKRAGSDAIEGLPETAAAAVTSESPAAWIAAAARLELGVDTTMYRGVSGLDSMGVLELRGHDDDDPWLRLGDTLRTTTQRELAACVDAPASFDVELEISSAGTASVATFTPVTAAPASSNVDACVRAALLATPFPCTHDGQPAKAAFRMCVAPATPRATLRAKSG